MMDKLDVPDYSWAIVKMRGLFESGKAGWPTGPFYLNLRIMNGAKLLK
jgi:hypothetical protein